MALTPRFDRRRRRTANQRTLRAAIGCVGTGLHTGARVAVTLRPAPADTGIVFRREDVAGAASIRAGVEAVADTTRCTQLAAADGTRVGTVEHLMAALAAWGIDNLEIAVDGPELPALDGSAEPFFFLLGSAGIAEQDAPRRVLEIVRPIHVEHGGRTAVLRPHDGFAVDMAIDFAHPHVGRQRLALEIDAFTFPDELAGARTFGFADDVASLRAKGLARGGSLDNAVVVGANGVLNPEGLRWPDEFVRHKALDAVGDLYLAGPIAGRFEGRGSGHQLHVKLLRRLFDEPDAWRRTAPGENDEAPLELARLGAD
ncbi:MAG: UDP-3-O-acyl-N-acetylglucosamine deacetylase [Alphaproteobacteria bacterium]